MPEELTDDQVMAVSTLGIMRSLEMLEKFVVNNIDPESLRDAVDRELLNRVKLRMNTGEHPIGVYLKPMN